MTVAWKVRGYDVERLLGRGASSEVWRARVHATGEAVALKRLTLGSELQRRRAVTEAAALTVLDHPNLVRLHDIVTTDDSAVLVLDLADGGSLAQLLAGRGRLTPAEVITVVAPVAAALAYVHRGGVVHGDVTPANILFTPGGVALLADLGVSRLTGDDTDAESTPAYLDPAVASGSVPAPASDVFMLGAVALHALTGAAVWPGPDAATALAAARAGELGDVAVRLTRAGVPDAMATVVLRALVVDPHRRCSAAEFALDLRHSGTPIAVELSAGSGRSAAGDDHGMTTSAADLVRYGRTTPRAGRRAAAPYDPRHAAAPASAVAAPVVTAAGPRSRVAPSGAPPPTHAVARPRPTLPARRRAPRLGRRHAVAASAVLVVLAGGAVAVAATRPGSPPVARSRPTAGVPAVDWAAELRALDIVRARAYATGDPALLSRVYVPGPLLAADSAQLRRLVPSGCRLPGATTRYEQLHAAPTAAGAVVRARATIPATTLRCTGSPGQVAAAVGPAPVRLDLVRTPQGVRIARQQVG